MLGTLTKHLSPGFHQSPQVEVSYQHIPLTKKKNTNQQKGNIFAEIFKPILKKKNSLGSHNGYNQENKI